MQVLLQAKAMCAPSPGMVRLPDPAGPAGNNAPFFQITFRKDHLEACLFSLGCDVMARERSNFETYSMCYEHVLQHTRQRLCQKEQVGTQGEENQVGEGVWAGDPGVTQKRK